MNKKFVIVYIGLLFTLGISGFCLNDRFTYNVLDEIVGGCGSGPCVSWGACGGGGGGGGCGEPELACTGGRCSSSCPSGASNQFCLGYSGSCATYTGHCSIMETYNCQPALFDPPRCLCVKIGVLGPCPRNLCG